MKDLIIVLILLIIEFLFGSKEFIFIVFLLSIIISISRKSPNILAMFVMLTILSLFSNVIFLKDLYTSIHSEIYLSFSNFITNFFSTEISVFLISITIGTSEVKLSQNIYETFKQFNLLHVVSISGANFILINDFLTKIKKYINKNYISIASILIQTYYIILIGINNLPALRAFIFTSISLYSSITGRPIKFINRLLTTIIVIFTLNPENLTSKSLWLSISFSIIYKYLELKPLSNIFNNELKKLSIVFIISMIIFKSENPDFIANLVFGITYPTIFFLTFGTYILSLLNVHITLLIKFIELLINLIFMSLDQLSSQLNTLLQLGLFIAILVITTKSLFHRRIYEYSKFAQ